MQRSYSSPECTIGFKIPLKNTIASGELSAPLQITGLSSSSSPTLFFTPLLEEEEGDRREALDSRCQEIQEVWLGADAAVMRRSHVWKERLWGSWQSSCAGGRTSWKGPEPFKKGIQDYRVREEIIKRRRGRGPARAREFGKGERKPGWESDPASQQTSKWARGEQRGEVESFTLAKWL